MGTVILVGLAGWVASLIDGALGMGFGPTSSTILLVAGLSPAAVSTTVNVAKVATGAAGGAAHWRFGNVDRRLVVKLAAPGCVGAVTGVTVLANVDGERLRPYLAALLLVVGARMLVRFGAGAPGAPDPRRALPRDPDLDSRALVPAAFLGGVTNGLVGTWGPVVTPVLLHREDIEPRIAIGSSNTAEVAVALAASGSLLTSLHGAGVEPAMLAAILIGGVIAAPLAAWVVRHLRPRLLGIAAAGLLLVTNVQVVADAAGGGAARWPASALVTATCVVVAIRPWRPLPTT